MHDRHGRGIDESRTAVFFGNGESQNTQRGTELTKERNVECFGFVVGYGLWLDLRIIVFGVRRSLMCYWCSHIMIE